MSYVLGISAYYHESSTCLIDSRSGKVISYAKEESYSRIKGDSSFPERAIKEVLNSAKITGEDLNRVVFYERPLSAFIEPLKIAALHMPKSLRFAVNQLSKAFSGSLGFEADLRSFIPSFKGSILYLDHHLSHLYSALASSSQTQELCGIVVDGFGDTACTSIYKVKSPTDIELMWKSEYPHSLGLFYSAITDFLGFAVNEGEYKVMGLAAYGEPRYLEKIRSLGGFINGKFKLNLRYFDFHHSIKRSYSDALTELFNVAPRPAGMKLKKGTDEFKLYADIACSAQKYLEELLAQLFQMGEEMTGTNRYLFSGGVAMNSVAISELVKELHPDSFHIAISPGDAGASIGAAMFGALKENEIINPLYIPSPFISPRNELSFSELVAENGSWKRLCGLDSAVDQCANLFNQGHVVATCVGAGEIGPRALGHRSLLCNGESDAAVRYLNEIIKGRSSFRPTAPATTLHHANDLYSLDDRLMDAYKVMGATAMAKPSAANLPTTHIDGSARIQIVEADSLIGTIINSPQADFKIVANTSFNFSSDPTVSNIESALLSLITMKVPYFLCDDGLFKAERGA